VAGADVAEVARGHGEGDLFVVGAGGGEIALEVVHDLCGDARPVDRVDRADLVARLEGGVVGDRLHDVLAVVEHAADGDVEDVGIRSEYICARWNALIRPCGESMKT
jgi:hypothetical protein